MTLGKDQSLHLRAQIFTSFGYQGSVWRQNVGCMVFEALRLLHGGEDYVTEALTEDEATRLSGLHQGKSRC